MKFKKYLSHLLPAIMAVLLMLSFASCGSSVPKTKDAVFNFYSKVQLGEAKSAVDKALGVKPVADTSSYALKGTYGYTDSTGIYGVSVVFDDSQKVMSKTVIYGSHSVLAPFMKSSVTAAQAKQVTNGVSYEKAAQLLGGDGIECSKTSMSEDYKSFSKIMRWGNSDGSCVQIVLSETDSVLNSIFMP